MAEKEKETDEKWAVDNVPTEVEPMVVNTETKEGYSTPVALAQILNNQEKILAALKQLLS